MFLFNLVLFFLLASIANASNSTCQRETGDELLLSQPLLKISLLGGPNVERTFKGYRITCVESNLPLNLGSLLDLEILNGGIGCDSVGLRVRVGRLISIGLGVNVYGIKLSSANETLICAN